MAPDAGPSIPRHRDRYSAKPVGSDSSNEDTPTDYPRILGSSGPRVIQDLPAGEDKTNPKAESERRLTAYSQSGLGSFPPSRQVLPPPVRSAAERIVVTATNVDDRTFADLAGHTNGPDIPVPPPTIIHPVSPSLPSDSPGSVTDWLASSGHGVAMPAMAELGPVGGEMTRSPDQHQRRGFRPTVLVRVKRSDPTEPTAASGLTREYRGRVASTPAAPIPSTAVSSTDIPAQPGVLVPPHTNHVRRSSAPDGASERGRLPVARERRRDVVRTQEHRQRVASTPAAPKSTNIVSGTDTGAQLDGLVLLHNAHTHRLLAPDGAAERERALATGGLRREEVPAQDHRERVTSAPAAPIPSITVSDTTTDAQPDDLVPFRTTHARRSSAPDGASGHDLVLPEGHRREERVQGQRLRVESMPIAPKPSITSSGTGTGARLNSLVPSHTADTRRELGFKEAYERDLKARDAKQRAELTAGHERGTLEQPGRADTTGSGYQNNAGGTMSGLNSRAGLAAMGAPPPVGTENSVRTGGERSHRPGEALPPTGRPQQPHALVGQQIGLYEHQVQTQHLRQPQPAPPPRPQPYPPSQAQLYPPQQPNPQKAYASPQQQPDRAGSDQMLPPGLPRGALLPPTPGSGRVVEASSGQPSRANDLETAHRINAGAPAGPSMPSHPQLSQSRGGDSNTGNSRDSYARPPLPPVSQREPGRGLGPQVQSMDPPRQVPSLGSHATQPLNHRQQLQQSDLHRQSLHGPVANQGVQSMVMSNHPNEPVMLAKRALSSGATQQPRSQSADAPWRPKPSEMYQPPPLPPTRQHTTSAPIVARYSAIEEPDTRPLSVNTMPTAPPPHEAEPESASSVAAEPSPSPRTPETEHIYLGDSKVASLGVSGASTVGYADLTLDTNSADRLNADDDRFRMAAVPRKTGGETTPSFLPESISRNIAGLTVGHTNHARDMEDRNLTTTTFYTAEVFEVTTPGVTASVNRPTQDTRTDPTPRRIDGSYSPSNTVSISPEDKFRITADTPADDIINYFERIAGLDNYTSKLIQTQPLDQRGRGGSADVYRVATTNGPHVAAKCVYVHPSAGDNKILKRTAKELEVWSKLRHENVLELLGLAKFNGRVAMVSPWMDLGNVVAFVNERPDKNRYQLSLQIARAVVYLHAQEIVHGDIKGDNVLIASDGKPKLADFGLTMATETNLLVSATNAGGGTVRWMAPELFAEEGCRSKEADVYALGMTMLETLTGKLPFAEVGNVMAIPSALSKRQIPRRPEYLLPRSRLKDAFWKAMTECWIYEPIQRATVTQVEGLLASALKEDGPHVGNPLAV